MPQKFPGATRRDFTRNRVKGPKFSGAARRNPTNRAKRPKIFRRYAPGDPPPDFPTHIKYVSTALFSSLAYSKRGQFEIDSLRALSVEKGTPTHASCHSWPQRTILWPWRHGSCLQPGGSGGCRVSGSLLLACRNCTVAPPLTVAASHLSSPFEQPLDCAPLSSPWTAPLWPHAACRNLPTPRLPTPPLSGTP